MYKLFTDKTELFECNIKLEGASLKNSQALVAEEGSVLSTETTIAREAIENAVVVEDAVGFGEPGQ